jgi:ABC-type branched-subunit amino acid transport system substrate-binding protein
LRTRPRTLTILALAAPLALAVAACSGGSGPRPAYEAAFKSHGLDVVGDYTFPAGTTDFSSFIANAKAKGAQLLAGQTDLADGVARWKQVKSLGLRPKAAFLAATRSLRC